MKKLTIQRYSDNGKGFRDLDGSETTSGPELLWYFSDEAIGFTDSQQNNPFQKFIRGLTFTLDGERIGIRIDSRVSDEREPNIVRYHRTKEGHAIAECTIFDPNAERLKRFVTESKRVYLSMSTDSYFPHTTGRIVTLTKKKPNLRLYSPVGTMELMVI